METNGRHTPAPWSVHWGTAQGGEGHWIMDSSDHCELSRVAMVAFHDDTPGETRANALLIASAPALLDAIDQVTAALETCMAHYGDRMTDADRRSRTLAIAAARRAQANAEGYQTWADAVAASCDE